MLYDPSESAAIRLVTLAQLSQRGSWQLELAHDRAEHLLIWMTRGQGVALLDGARRGLGVHNAIFVPARHLFSLSPGRQGFGQVLVIPAGSGLTLPQTPHHLRTREVGAQSELTVLLESLGREQNAARPLCDSAMHALADLAAIWLRRQLPGDADPPERPNAARRLSRAYCQRLTEHFASGASMADHATALGVTPTHLTRVCRAETGRTAAELLTERSLHAARQLLTGTGIAVQDIAAHLGFGSPAYFTRFIQHHTGQTPTGLRRAATSAESRLRSPTRA